MTAPPTARRRRGGVVLGIVLIALGGLFLVDRVVGIDLGARRLAAVRDRPGRRPARLGAHDDRTEGVGLAVAGGITTVVGLILAVQNATGLWATWAYAWALVGPGGDRHRPHRIRARPSRPGARRERVALARSGLGLFVAFGLFFEGVIGLSGTPFLTSDAGPYILVGAGS